MEHLKVISVSGPLYFPDWRIYSVKASGVGVSVPLNKVAIL
ncbi:MAG: hypothetical protein ABI358_02010 [Ginsengibacter sp.]